MVYIKKTLEGSWVGINIYEDNLELLSTHLIQVMKLAGVKDLKTAFAELDALNFEATGVPNF